jgi:hypothetical protein
MGRVSAFSVNDSLFRLPPTKVIRELFDKLQVSPYQRGEYLEAFDHFVEASLSSAGTELSELKSVFAFGN